MNFIALKLLEKIPTAVQSKGQEVQRKGAQATVFGGPVTEKSYNLEVITDEDVFLAGPLLGVKLL